MSANRKRHFARKGPDPESSDEESEIYSSENEKQAMVLKDDERDIQTRSTETKSEEEAEEPLSEDEFESDTGSSNYSDDSEPAVQLSRPKFVKKNKGGKSTAVPADIKQSTLEFIERSVRAETQLNHVVDDTDGLDPKAEYEAWKLRAEARSRREYDRLAAIEKEYEERELAREKESKRPKLL